MREHKFLLCLRLIGMIFIAGLLFTALVITVLADSSFHNALYCVLELGKIERDVRSVVVQVSQCLALFVWLTSSYISRISSLLSPADVDKYGSWIGAFVVSRMHPNQANVAKAEQLTSRAQARLMRPDRCAEGSKILYWAKLWRYLYILMTDSFIWQIIAMFFGVAIGITLVVVARYSLVNPHDENLTSLGFGQILSVCTLLLPVMGFLSAYYGEFMLFCFNLGQTLMNNDL